MKIRIILTAALLALTGAAPALASDYPNRPIKLVVPYVAGGSTDATARMVAEQLSKQLKQPVVVENRAGAGGNVGATAVARSEPDGYTLLLMSSGHAANRALYKSLGYDLVADFEPVSRIAIIPNVLVVRADSPINSLQDLVDKAKAKKTSFSYGSAGNGTAQHLAGSLFSSMVGVPLTHIPYRGGAPAVTDLMGGQIDMVFAPQVEVLPFIESKKLKPLGVTTATRSTALPDVPPIGEVLPGYETLLWNGLLVRKGTPPEIVAALNRATQQGLADPEVQSQMRRQGASIATTTPEGLRQFLAAEITKWAHLVKISGATVE
jgi:tripartite-type tricarboxylate transporter receptor subunit TctC